MQEVAASTLIIGGELDMEAIKRIVCMAEEVGFNVVSDISDKRATHLELFGEEVAYGGVGSKAVRYLDDAGIEYSLEHAAVANSYEANMIASIGGKRHNRVKAADERLKDAARCIHSGDGDKAIELIEECRRGEYGIPAVPELTVVVSDAQKERAREIGAESASEGNKVGLGNKKLNQYIYGELGISHGMKGGIECDIALTEAFNEGVESLERKLEEIQGGE